MQLSLRSLYVGNPYYSSSEIPSYHAPSSVKIVSIKFFEWHLRQEIAENEFHALLEVQYRFQLNLTIAHSLSSSLKVQSQQSSALHYSSLVKHLRTYCSMFFFRRNCATHTLQKENPYSNFFRSAAKSRGQGRKVLQQSQSIYFVSIFHLSLQYMWSMRRFSYKGTMRKSTMRLWKNENLNDVVLIFERSHPNNII